MKRYFFIVLLIAILPLSLKSQKIFIHGKVIDTNTKKPLQYVNIHIKETNIGTVSNIEGEFSLEINDEIQKDTIIFSYIGYQSVYLATNNRKGYLLIELKPYVEQIQSVIILAKKTNPIDIIKKANENLSANVNDSIYNVNVFTRNIIKKDTVYISYRKTVTNVLTTNDNIWFVKGNIIADKYLSFSSWRKDIDMKKVPVFRLNDAPVDYQRSIISDNDLEKKIIKLDTVIFSENSTIYVIDIFSKKIDSAIISKIYNIINKSPSPYTLIYDTCLQHIGSAFLNNENTIFIRYYIDKKQNYNIIKQLLLFVSSSGSKKTFEYTISEFTNFSGQSNLKYVISFRETIFQEKKKEAIFIKSLFESFCYDYVNVVNFSDTSNTFIWHKYSKQINENSTSYDNWGNISTYIKTDTLEEDAIKQIENSIRIKNEK